MLPILTSLVVSAPTVIDGCVRNEGLSSLFGKVFGVFS
jgi:hypothetical protein